jgi:hypothetical protein
VLAAIAVAATLTVLGASMPASGAAIKGTIEVISVTDQGTGLNAPVQGRRFDVAVRVVDESNQPLTLTKATSIRLTEVSGAGALGGTTTGVIAKNASTGTISGAIYSTFANGENGVVLRVSAFGGVELNPSRDVTVNVAATAFKASATPHVPLEVVDPNCVQPTAERPTCGVLQLPNGASGNVVTALGSCQGIVASNCSPNTGVVPGLLFTGLVNLKDADGDRLYCTPERDELATAPCNDPVTSILKCDKSKCGNSGAGVTQFPVLVDLTNVGTLTEAPPCPSRGILGANQNVCWDQSQSRKDIAGDLHSYVLFDIDYRMSHP